MDASKSSPPTAAALAELSIEESCKGWMLYFCLLFQGRKPKGQMRVARASERKIEDYLERHAQYLEGLDSEIEGAFERHSVKLRFLQFLFGFLKTVVPAIKTSGQMHKVPERIHGGLFEVKEAEMTPGIEKLEQFLSIFRPENFGTLAEVKERGFYVNMTESGDLVSPDVESHPGGALMALADFLIGTLKGELIGLTR